MSFPSTRSLAPFPSRGLFYLLLAWRSHVSLQQVKKFLSSKKQDHRYCLLFRGLFLSVAVANLLAYGYDNRPKRLFGFQCGKNFPPYAHFLIKRDFLIIFITILLMGYPHNSFCRVVSNRGFSSPNSHLLHPRTYPYLTLFQQFVSLIAFKE